MVSVIKFSTTHQYTVMFEVLKSVVLKIQFVWDVMLCHCASLGLIMNVKTLLSFEVLGTTHPAAQHHIPEDLGHLHKFYCAHTEHTAVTLALHAHCIEYTVTVAFNVNHSQYTTAVALHAQCNQ
jgi:hypothetical protein